METALNDRGIYKLFEEGQENPEFAKVFSQSNADLVAILYNYVKCNAVKAGLTAEIYVQGGLQQWLRGDAVSIKLFQILSKMQTPLAKEFFEER